MATLAYPATSVTYVCKGGRVWACVGVCGRAGERKSVRLSVRISACASVCGRVPGRECILFAEHENDATRHRNGSTYGMGACPDKLHTSQVISAVTSTLAEYGLDVSGCRTPVAEKELTVRYRRAAVCSMETPAAVRFRDSSMRAT